MIMRAGLIVMLGLGSAQAQDAAQTGPDMARLMQSLPENTLKKLRGAPEKFLKDAAGLIYGFGEDNGIDLAGIEAFVAAERARVRAGAMLPYLVADMDNDGDVTCDEIIRMANAAAAPKRGKVRLGYDQADANKDCSLSLIELRGFAQGVAMASLSAEDADVLRGFLLFDLDGDGKLVMDEVAMGVSAIIGMASKPEAVTPGSVPRAPSAPRDAV